MTRHLWRLLPAVLTFAVLPVTGRAQGGGAFAVVYTQAPGAEGAYSVMPKADYFTARKEAQAEARLTKMALDAARDEWNEAEREHRRREREKQYDDNRQRNSYKPVKRKSFPDIETAVVPTLRCAGLYATAAEAESRIAVLAEAQQKRASLGLSAKKPGSLSSSTPVRLESKMQSRISKSNYASGSFEKSGQGSRRNDNKPTGADIKKATDLYEKHLARLQSGEGEAGPGGRRALTPGLKKPSYLTDESDSKLKVKRIGGSLSRGFGEE